MYCSKCGALLADGARFCTKCGVGIGGTEGARPNQVMIQDSAIESVHNRAITGRNLKEAISILYDMEQDVYATSRMIQLIDQKIGKLGIRYRINEPVREQPRPSVAPTGVQAIYMICGLIGGIYGFSSQATGGYFSIVSQVFGAVVAGVIGLAIGYVLTLIASFSICKAKDSEAQAEADKKYNRDCAAHRQKLQDQEDRIKRELKEIQSLRIVKSKLEAKNIATCTQLEEHYDMVGIDEDYRNLVPIGYMKDYIRLGIATQLHGPNGLNFFIRQELRADMLQMTMEEISNKLSMLIDINKAVFGELVTLNNKCSQIIDGVEKTAHILGQNNRVLSELKEAESMNAYYNSRIAAEEEYRNRMDTICGRWL